MSTYSINDGTPFESSFLGSLDPNLILNKIPNNTSQIIVPEDVRDALYTIWDNVSFKKTSATGSSFSYIGLSGDNFLNDYLNGADGMKVLMGKPQLDNTDILDNFLIEYNTSSSNYTNSDFYFYNFKPDDFDDSSAQQQFTKVSFLSGDNSNNLFRTAPYILSQQNFGGTAIDLTIYNEGGKLIIDSAEELQIGSATTKVTLLSGTGSTGVKTLPGGSMGDIQTNLDNCEFGFITGASASIGDVLLMGASNSPYWGNLNINSIFTLNQILGSGNVTDGEDIIVSVDDVVYFGGTGATYANITNNNSYTSMVSPSGELRLGANTFRLDIEGVGSNKVLETDGSGYAFWATQSETDPGGVATNIQYNAGGTAGFGGSNLLKWDNSIGSMAVNASPIPYAISMYANATGGLYINPNGGTNPFTMEDGGTNFFETALFAEGYSTNINNNELDSSQYALSIRSNDLGGIYLDTRNDVTKAVNIVNEENLFFEIDITDGTNVIVDINDNEQTYALNVKHNDTGGLYIDSNSSNSPLLIEDFTGGNVYFKIDSSVNKYMTFDEGAEYGFIFGGGSSDYNNKFTFVNSGSRQHMTLLPDSGTNEFRIEYEDRSNVRSAAIAMSPGDSDGMYIGVVNTKTDALQLGRHNTTLTTYEPSISVYPGLQSIATFFDRDTTQPVVVGNTDAGGPPLGTKVTTNANKRSFGINIMPEVDDHLNGVHATVPSTISAFTTYGEGSSYLISEIQTSYLLIDTGDLSGSTLHRIGVYAESTPVTSLGTTLKIWNRTGGSISVSHLLGYTDTDLQNIFFPEKVGDPTVYTWLTGEMLELIYLPTTSGDIQTIIASQGGGSAASTILTEGGIWYKVN